METTEIPLVGFGGSGVKPALPLSLLRKLRQNVGVLSQLAVWLLVHVFNSHLRKEMQNMVISHSGEGLPEWDACPARW